MGSKKEYATYTGDDIRFKNKRVIVKPGSGKKRTIVVNDSMYGQVEIEVNKKDLTDYSPY